VISVDTLRADRLPAYGYRAVETPHVDALRRDGVLFENAYSNVPLTLPSHAALFTGLLPPANGVRDNLGYRLGEGPATLAGFLKTHGYTTGGAVSSIVLARTTGIARGFDFYDDDVEPTTINQSLGRVQRDGAEAARRLAAWVGETGERPFFAFLHLYEPHSPYEPPEPYKSRYAQPYDGEVARADEIVGDFLSPLRDRGLYDRSLIVFLSDHGEGLMDHGEQEHGVLLYRATLHVPLIVKLPKSERKGSTVRTPVSLVDVFPTIARLLALEPPGGIAGRPLPELVSGKDEPSRRIYAETFFPRLHLGWSDLASLIDERYHYIEAPRPELYDILADPQEKRDLSAGLPPAFRSMRLELARMPRPLKPPGSSDPEQVKKLAALGYISAGSAALDEKNLPDPKDRVAAVEAVKTGFGHLQANRFSEAAAVLRAVLDENPRMTDVWQMLAKAYTRLGRDEEAHRALLEAAKLSPGSPEVLLGLSEFYFETGRYPEARRHAELARDAGAPNAHENLARIALAEKDLATAEREANAALSAYPDRKLARAILARVKRERGDLPGALAQLDLAARQTTGARVPSLNFLRADILARMGRESEAEAGFRREIAEFPHVTAAWTGLALLYASQGREEPARRTLEELLRRVQTPEAYFAATRTYEVLGDPRAAAAVRARGRRLFPDARARTADAG
jgi:arylsulfatase A-like enzyme/Tfp pilus assembly protein PilF